MALGFVKQFDASIYDEEEFIEIWPEISEIGLEICEAVLEKMEPTTIFSPGSSSNEIAYIKGCLFMLGFSDVDKGTEVEVYDQYTSEAVTRTRIVMKSMGIKIEPLDTVDRMFVEGLISLFETSVESSVIKLWSVLKNARSRPTIVQQGVKKAETDPNASEPMKPAISSTVKGKQVKPGIDFPLDASMAERSVQYSLSGDGSKKLSNNFKVSDFKCRDGSDIILINPILIDILEKVKEKFGKPVKVVSGYRTPKYNKMLKGAAKNSQHMYGNAADIKIDGVSPKEIYDWMSTWHKGGLGLYPTFTHIDVRDTVGKDVARWGSGKMDIIS